MQAGAELDVAVLLATFNGGSYIEKQLTSLKENATPFTVHWIDDHSTDDTRHKVVEWTSRLGIPLREWHLPEHAGVPAAFFRLLDRVDADIYLFCDQDDIWQPGKIDSIVRNLRDDVTAPVLCFSDAILFSDAEPPGERRVLDLLEAKRSKALEASRIFMFSPAASHTFGFTRPLREMYLQHRDVAQGHARMHGAWIHTLALATGACRMLDNAPTTLYRQHPENATGALFRRGRGVRHWLATWRLQRFLRQRVSRHAQGFVLAAPTLPPSPQVDRMLKLAKLVARLDRRQSLVDVLRLTKYRAWWPSRRRAVWLAASCLCSSVEPEAK